MCGKSYKMFCRHARADQGIGGKWFVATVETWSRRPRASPPTSSWRLVRGAQDGRRGLRGQVREHLHRVDRAVLDPNLEVGVRPRRVAGGANQTHQLATMDDVTFLDPDRQQMAVKRFQAGIALD